MIGMMITMGLAIACFVFEAIAFQTIAQNRGYDKPWLAWIPYGNVYLKGAIADDINMRQGKTSKWRKWLLGLSIASTLGAFVMAIVIIVFGVSVAIFAETESGGGAVAMVFSIIFMVLMFLVIYAAAIAAAVINFITIYKVYKDYAPDNAVAYILLSIFVSVSYPFLLYSVRNNVPVSMGGVHTNPAPYAGVPQSNIYPQQSAGAPVSVPESPVVAAQPAPIPVQTPAPEPAPAPVEEQLPAQPEAETANEMPEQQ